MTIDQLNTQVQVTPRPEGTGTTTSGSTTGPGSGTDLISVLRPLVVQIIDEELQNRLRIAGLR